MEILPDEVIVQIFSFLESDSWLNTLLVCRRFHVIGCDSFDPNLKSNQIVLWAVQNRKVESLKRLLSDARVDVNVENSYPLYWAIWTEDFVLIELLIADSRADMNFHQTALLKVSVQNERWDIILGLLSDLKFRLTEENALYLVRKAATFGEWNIILSIIFEQNINVSPLQSEILEICLLTGRPDVALKILSHDSIVPSNEILQLACEYGELEVVKHLLQDPRVDPSDNHNELFIKACSEGNSDLVKCLLTHEKTDPSARNNEALQIATSAEIIEILTQDIRVLKIVNQQIDVKSNLSTQ